MKTEILFPSGATESQSVIVDIVEADTYQDAIILDKTPFHPEDYKWKDQPSDKGYIMYGDKKFAVNKAIVFYSKDKNFVFDEQINKSKPDHSIGLFGVAHLIDKNHNIKRGDKINVFVDKEYRHSLSKAHTAAHLMSLALNKALSSHWSKEYKKDCLRSYNFDQAAIFSSKIEPVKSIDTYRLNKSAKRKGIDTNYILKNPKTIEKEVNELLIQWTKENSRSYIDSEEPFIDSNRLWKTKIQSTEVSIPCGGTHIDNIRNLKNISAKIEIDSNFLIIHTQVS
ncbi:Alanine--tRNA ligase, organellar chromatophore [Marinomonas spartinae]|uniref:hypothetical protein n=1 Tax=Marinomonas spartinae TaxID=1792290 RepID=UPI00080911E3|nr:hypothetical protein [Marinomonas spartinae]SBS39214.1 Alanine--tRNA ligase, organellar chromatophore [Marinomonas spartinae]